MSGIKNIRIDGIDDRIVGTFSPEDWVKLTGSRSVASGRYRRGENGDITAPLLLSQHHYWAAKGWTLIEVTHLGGMDDPRATHHVERVMPKPAA